MLQMRTSEATEQRSTAPHTHTHTLDALCAPVCVRAPVWYGAAAHLIGLLRLFKRSGIVLQAPTQKLKY